MDQLASDFAILFSNFGGPEWQRQGVLAVLTKVQPFCSPCAPLDLVFGSLGSFYHARIDEFCKRVPAGAILVANPPYLEVELLACADRVPSCRFWSQNVSTFILISPRTKIPKYRQNIKIRMYFDIFNFIFATFAKFKFRELFQFIFLPT